MAAKDQATTISLLKAEVDIVESIKEGEIGKRDPDVVAREANERHARQRRAAVEALERFVRVYEEQRRRPAISTPALAMFESFQRQPATNAEA